MTISPAMLEQFTEEELAILAYAWELEARPEQIPPEGNWQYWLVLAGRGWGKTRVGSEWVRQCIRKYPLVNLIGATSDDVRDIMVEGESGILAVCPADERPYYSSAKRRLEWPNGARSLLFTADEPDRLRGKQHMKLWADELAAWRYSESWDQAMLGLRLGDSPQALITTTPRPIMLIKDLLKDPATIVTRGRTIDNKKNLAPAFLETITKKYEGTRLGRQELGGEVLDDNPSALWKRSLIDATRLSVVPCDLTRVVVAIDPAVTSNPDSDYTGIVVVAQGSDGHGYVLEDVSLISSPSGWASVAIKQYHKYDADRVVAEVNNGGEMVEAVMRNVDPEISFIAVRASRGKVVRAEPVAALYEQGRVHHVGSFPELEDEMCDYNPADTNAPSPDRMDALVWGLSYLFETDAGGILRHYSSMVEAKKGK